MSGLQWRALTTTVGGATVLRTTQTVQHWFGSTLDPHNGVTYSYNMRRRLQSQFRKDLLG